MFGYKELPKYNRQYQGHEAVLLCISKLKLPIHY
jgi:hypothetical protein